jgi:acetyl esterase/lipase
MKRCCVGLAAGLLVLAGWLVPAGAEDVKAFTRTEDVIYGRKFGTALTMDVFTPTKDANGAAIIVVVSGGWFSAHETIPTPFVQGYVKEFTGRGYTVFAVVHGSQPKFTIPEAVADMKRSVRFIRANAKMFKIDPERIGVAGGSAGGHLSLMLGTANDPGNSKAQDPVEKGPCRVQAVACFFPPTDFLNYGEKGKKIFAWEPVWKPELGIRPAFDFREQDPKTRLFGRIKDEKKIDDILGKVSPITHVSKESAPTMIIFGDADKLVPVQQGEIMITKLKDAGVPAELVVKKGAGHGWARMEKDIATLAGWFDKHLKKKEK